MSTTVTSRTKNRKPKRKPAAVRVALDRLVRKREREAFEAGWIAGAERTNDIYHGYSRLSKNLTDSWNEYRRKTALPNTRLGQTE